MTHRLRPRKTVGFIGITLYLLFSAIVILGDKGPRIKLKEESWDFGKIKQGEMRKHVFTFSNEGNSPLLIKRVRTTCGCTAALVSEKSIDPGKKGKIEVTLNTRGYEGTIKKYIFMETNDPAAPQKQLTVEARIEVPPRPRIDLDRYSIDVGLILDTEEIQAKAKIKNRGELELKVDCNHKNAAFYQRGKKASFPLKIAAGKEAEIDIKIPPLKRKGLMREYVLIKSNDPYRSTLSLYLSGYVVSREQLKELFAKYKDILD